LEVLMAGIKGMKGEGLGGRREGAGRPRGARNKRTRDTVERACAGKAAEFLHPKPSRLPERLPLPHEIPTWMLEDFDRRLKEDQEKNPWRYGLPVPKPKLVPNPRDFTPDPKRKDPYFAQFDVDYRGGGSGKRWEPGEREELQELARQ
jgi:hypothetical protein